MRKFILTVCIIFAIVAVSCQSMDKPEYIDSIVETMIANVDPIELQNIEVGIPTMLLGRIEQIHVNTKFHPRKNHVSLSFQYTTSTNELYFSAYARQVYAAAVDKYLKEFENHKLIKKDYGTRYTYGRMASYLKWGAFQLTSYSTPEMQFGYIFKGPHPYFTIVIKPADNEAFNNDKVPANIEMILYMTKEQALALKHVFSEENIKEALSTVSIPDASSTADEY